MAKLLCEKGLDVITYRLIKSEEFNLNTTDDISYAMNFSKNIVSPIPFSKDKNHITDFLEKGNKLSVEEFLSHLKSNHYLIGGNIPKQVVEICNENKTSYLDLMKVDEIAMLNTIATA